MSSAIRRAPATVASEKLFDAALTARQRGAFDSAAALLVDAWAAEPSDLTPLLELSFLNDEMGLRTDLRRRMDAIARGAGDHAFVACVRRLLSDTSHRPTVHAIALATHPATRACGRLLASQRVWDDSLPSLWRHEPRSPAVFTGFLESLVRADAPRAWRMARDEAHANVHPMRRVAAYVIGARTLHRMGRHDEAERWEREASERAERWGVGAALHLHRGLQAHVHILAEGDGSDELSRHAHVVADRSREALYRLLPRTDARGRAMTLFQLGTDAQANGRLAQADTLFRRLTALADTIDNDRLEGAARARTGRTLVKLGRLAEAERELHLAAALAQREGALIVLRETAHDLLHLYEATGSFDSASGAGMDFVRYADVAGTMPTRMMAHHDLGWLYRRSGKTLLAEGEFRRMVADVDTLRSHSHWAGEYFESAGQLERAREYYRRALRDVQDRSRALTALVRVSEALGDVDDALEYGRLADRDTGMWHPEYAPVLPGLFARHGNVREARVQFRNARHLLRTAGKQWAFAQIALESAELEVTLGNFADAAALADSAGATALLLGARELDVRARALSALVSMQLDRSKDDALNALDMAVGAGDAMRLPQLSAALHVIRGEALVRAGRAEAGMRSYERAADWVDSTVQKIETDPSRASYRTTQISVSNAALHAILDTDVSERAMRYVHWSGRRKGSPAAARLGAVIASLGTDEAFVDYVVLDSVVAALVVTRDTTALIRLTISPGSLRSLVARFRAPIAPRVGSRIDVAHVGFDERAALDLHDAIVAPMRGAIGDRARLIISPDGVLHNVPFDALISAAAPARRYLLDDFEIRYFTAIGVRRPPPAREGLRPLAFAGADAFGATGNVAEIAALREAFGDAVRVLQARSTTKAELRASVPRSSVLHFATHAEANDLNPDLARLALVADSAEGGWLHAFEIRQWRLNGALVVLSACETASGRLAGGEGALSLSRAFLQAGAHSTISTLWPVGAPTARFMEYFYRQLAAGAPPARALRVARIELRRSGFDQPFYWAPFLLTARLP